MKVKNKVVIVTGASSGIGLATAKLLTEKGAKVALVARSIDKLKEIEQKLPDSFAIQTDMSKEDQIAEMVKKAKDHFGQIDILVNNAGRGYDAPVEKIELETFRELIELNLIGPIVTTQQVIPIMREQKEGSIVNISSGTAVMAIPNMSAYSSLKRALVGISLTARNELEKDNIKVSVVYPYATETNFEKNTIREGVPQFEGDLPMKMDSAEFVAEKILEAIETGEAEVFVHDWMKNRKH